MKNLQINVLVIVTILAAFIGAYRWDSARNRGREYGYFGQFNRVGHALAAIPEVTITDSWHNLDVTLEEFGFSITVSGQPVRLTFNETDRIRKMQRAEAVEVLRQRIQSELSSSLTKK